jgi:NO-binding membrane sensor protein with MHYT domain
MEERMNGLVSLISGVFGVALSILVEVIPGFKLWWDNLPTEQKRPARAIAALVIVASIAALHFTGVYDFGLGAVITFEIAMNIVWAWVSFVIGAEMTFQTFEKSFPRNRE